MFISVINFFIHDAISLSRNKCQYYTCCTHKKMSNNLEIMNKVGIITSAHYSLESINMSTGHRGAYEEYTIGSTFYLMNCWNTLSLHANVTKAGWLPCIVILVLCSDVFEVL